MDTVVVVLGKDYIVGDFYANVATTMKIRAG